MKQFCLFFLLFLGLATTSFAGKVYKWTDENGQVHYSTFPPAKVDTEKVRVPSSANQTKTHSSTSQGKKYYRGERARRESEEKRKLREERKKKQAAKNYDRKYGAEARLKKLEAEKRQKQMREEQARRERIRKSEQAKKNEQLEEKWKKVAEKLIGFEDECKAAHGTDCGNPDYLRKWVKKKYAPKK